MPVSVLPTLLPLPQIILSAQVLVVCIVGELPIASPVPPALITLLRAPVPEGSGRQADPGVNSPTVVNGRGFSCTEAQFSPSLSLHPRKWVPECTLTFPTQQHSQWMVQWHYWGTWGMPVVAMPPSHHSSAVASEQQLAALGLVQRARLVVEAEGTALTPKPSSPVGEDAPEPPLVVKSSSLSPEEAVAGPSRASPLDNFKEHQALLSQVVENLALEVEEMAEQMDILFNILSAPLQPMLQKWCTMVSLRLPVLSGKFIPPTSKRTEKKFFIPAKGFEYLYTHPLPGSLVVSAAMKETRRDIPV
ncbi:uncharacterized protein LOC115636339 [Gopherus evgoodei]|uniref:uncharacterized protein LOC115636339 n=1 Tax=Gopherus evgoodei TaxID=1825980 RepID=UPI0011D0338F|nr:uncharacterized protein LOC115636339 [Gopherus evgoodei]